MTCSCDLTQAIKSINYPYIRQFHSNCTILDTTSLSNVNVPGQIKPIRTAKVTMKPRKNDRRSYKKTPDFPFLTKEGVALKERRQYVDRRIRNMEVAWFKA